MEHRHVGGLVACSGRQEAAELLLPLALGGGTLGHVEVLRPALCRNRGREVGHLLRLERQELIAGLSRL